MGHATSQLQQGKVEVLCPVPARVARPACTDGEADESSAGGGPFAWKQIYDTRDVIAATIMEGVS